MNGARGVVVGFSPAADSACGSVVPVVEFCGGLTGAPVRVEVEPDEWTIELGGRTIASRRQVREGGAVASDVCPRHAPASSPSQVPLKLAYALSIHKAQGMSIDLLDVSLASVFEYGQVYVALSRATSLARCRISGFNARNVKAHPRVLAFYQKLRRAGGGEARAPAAAPLRPPPAPPRAAAPPQALPRGYGGVPSAAPGPALTLPVPLGVGGAGAVQRPPPPPPPVTELPDSRRAYDFQPPPPPPTSRGPPAAAAAASLRALPPPPPPAALGSGFDELLSAVQEG